MDKRKLERFFSKTDTEYTIGLGMLLVAFICLWLGFNYHNYLFWVGLLSGVVGIFLFFMGSIGRIGLEDIDKAAEDRIIGFGQSMMEDPHIIKRKAGHIEPTYICQYDYEGEKLESRHAKDNFWRTSQYSALRIVYMTDALIFTRREFSLLSDYEVDTPATEYKYSELGEAEIVRDTVTLKNGKNAHAVKRARLRLSDAAGNVVLLSQVPDDMDSDAIAANINKFIRNKQAT